MPKNDCGAVCIITWGQQEKNVQISLLCKAKITCWQETKEMESASDKQVLEL